MPLEWRSNDEKTERVRELLRELGPATSAQLLENPASREACC